MTAVFEGGDLADVEQTEELPPLAPVAVPVQVDGPVRVQQVPTVAADARTYILGDAATKILGRDPRRSVAILMAATGAVPFLFGYSQAAADAGTAAAWPAGLALPLHSNEEVWVRSGTPGTPVTLTVVAENWAG